MARPHAFQRWTDGTIRRGIPRLHIRRNEIKATLLLDMVRNPLAKDFVIALPARSSEIFLLEAAPNAARDSWRTESPSKR
jgi:hypothetical protein